MNPVTFHLCQKISEYFRSQNLAQVQTPMVLRYPAPEPNLNPLKAPLPQTAKTTTEKPPARRATKPPSPTANGWYRTSPELELKKLVAKTQQSLFEFAAVKRGDVATPTHLASFTMLEWYRTNSSLKELEQDLKHILALALQTTGASHFRHLGAKCDPKRKWLKKTTRQISASTSEEAFYRNLQRQPTTAPLLVSNWHLEHQMLARTTNGLMERVELYVCGVELANGCMELASPTQTKRLLTKWQRQTQRPFDPAYITSSKQLTNVAGMALGLERLVMLAQGSDNIRNAL